MIMIMNLKEELWLVLELCDGGSLLEVADILKKRGEDFNEDEIKPIIAYRLFYCIYCINFQKFSKVILNVPV